MVSYKNAFVTKLYRFYMHCIIFTYKNTNKNTFN